VQNPIFIGNFGLTRFIVATAFRALQYSVVPTGADDDTNNGKAAPDGVPPGFSILAFK